MVTVWRRDSEGWKQENGREATGHSREVGASLSPVWTPLLRPDAFAFGMLYIEMQMDWVGGGILKAKVTGLTGELDVKCERKSARYLA